MFENSPLEYLKKAVIELQTILAVTHIYFIVRNFCEKKISRIGKTAKFLHFRGINFRGRRNTTKFAGIYFRVYAKNKIFNFSFSLTGFNKAREIIQQVILTEMQVILIIECAKRKEKKIIIAQKKLKKLQFRAINFRG